MRDYLVTFHKVLSDSTGHDRYVLQRRTIVAAPSDVAAAYAAKAMFTRAAGIADWRMRADTCEVVELRAPGRDGPAPTRRRAVPAAFLPA